MRNACRFVGNDCTGHAAGRAIAEAIDVTQLQDAGVPQVVVRWHGGQCIPFR